MLTQLRVKNFRLLRDVTIDLGGLTVFIGPNSSGKSTVLEVLDFLGRCSTDGLPDALQAHGGFDSVRTIGVREPVQIATRWAFFSGDGTKRRTWILEWTIELDRVENGSVVVRRERLVDHAGEAPRSIVETTPDGRRVVNPENPTEDEQEHPPAVTAPTSLAFDAFRDEDRYPALGDLNFVASELRVLGSLTASPAWARPGAAIVSARDSLVLAPDEHLGRQGLGLANALYNLWMNHGQLWSELERAFRAEFPFVRRIVFPPDPGGSKISFAIEDDRYPDRKVYASEMSDGMVAYLILLAAIMQPRQVAVLGLDEPDATIHPTALRRLLELAQQDHAKRSLVIVTHSNALLDELREPAEQIRVVEGTPGGATIRRLDAEALAAWRQQYTLSDLRHMGHVDRPNVAYDPGSAADGARPIAEPPRAASTGREAVPREKPRRPKARASKG
jgi:predicted ATPase